MSQDFSVLLHTPTDGTDGDCTASLKNPRGIEPRRILPQPRGSQAHTCMSPQSSDCLTFIHNLKPSDPSIFFRTPHKTLRDQRDNPSVGFSGNMLERQDKFIFTESTIDTEYCKLCDTIKECAEIVFSHYANLQNMYDRRIVPILEGKQQLPDIGADWAFEYLTLTRIISPKDYEIVKDVIIKQIEWMNKRQEPNIVEYYPRLEEIIDSMEQQFPID